MTKDELVEMLERRGIVTTDPDHADKCCGQPRDEDGFCSYREGHPIYVARNAQSATPLLSELVATIRWVGPSTAERIARDVYDLLSDKGLLPEVAW